MHLDKVAGKKKDKTATRLFSSLPQGSESCGARQGQHLGVQHSPGQGRAAACAGWPCRLPPSEAGCLQSIPSASGQLHLQLSLGLLVCGQRQRTYICPHSTSSSFCSSSHTLQSWSHLSPEQPILQEASLNRNLHGRGDNIIPNIPD